MALNTEIDETLLTLEDVAHLLGGAGQLPLETIRKLAPVIATDPRFTGHVERLESQARDAGIDTGVDEWPVAAFYCHHDFERLVETEGWQHPAEVLDPDGTLGIAYRELVRLAGARVAGARAAEEQATGTPESARLPEVQEKLERAWAEEKAWEAPIRRIASHLEDHDPEAAELLLTQVLAQYRFRRRLAER